MKGDLSRTRLRGEDFERVVAQQGRIQLDADWNQQQAVTDRRLNTLAADVLGHGGLLARAVVPRSSPGFALHVHRGTTFAAGSAAQRIAFSGSLTADASGARTAFSVEAWLRPAPIASSADANGARRPLVTRATDTDGEFSVFLDASHAVIFERRLADGTLQSVTSRGKLRTERFGQLVCIDTGQAMEIWLDGVLDSLVAASTQGRAAVTVPIVVGGTSAVALGDVESVTLWTTRLLRDDIETAYLLQHSPVSSAASWTATTDLCAPVLCVGPGRCYVAGRLGMHRDHRSVTEHLPTAPGANIHAYIDVWDRYVSAFEDPALADPALGGQDTTGRLRTVAHVGFSALAPQDLRAAYAANEDRGTLALTPATATPSENALYRFEVHADGDAARSDAPSTPAIISVEFDSADAATGTITVMTGAVQWSPGTFLEVVGSRGTGGTIRTLRVVGVAPSAATLQRFAVNGLLPQDANLHVRPLASIVWSSDNAHGVFAVDSRSITVRDRSTKLTVRDAGGRAQLLQRNGGVVVVTDERRVMSGQPGFVTEIVGLNTDVPGSIDVVVNGVIDDIGEGATLRMWDGIVPVDADAITAVQTGDLRARFGAIGTYRSGDYWTAVVRPNARLGERLEWPSIAGVGAFLPPEGIDHAYGLLAEIALDSDGVPRVLTDYRVIVGAPGDTDFNAAVSAPKDPPAIAVDEPTEPVAAPTETVVVNRIQVDVDALPDGVMVVGARAIRGYESTGAVVEAIVDRPEWHALRTAPGAGEADLAVVDGTVYALFRTGRFFALDPAHPDNPWEPLRKYGGERTDYTLAAAGGRIYVVGGRDTRGRPSSQIDVYDPAQDVWTRLVIPMRAARAQPFVSADGGRSLLIGGGTRRSWIGSVFRSRSVERYDLDAERSSRAPALPVRMTGAAAIMHRGSVFVLQPGSGVVRRLRPRAAEWSIAALLDERIEAPAFASVARDALVVADRANGSLVRVDLDTGELLPLPALPAISGGIGAWEGGVICVGGFSLGSAIGGVSSLHLFDRLHVHRRSDRAHHHSEEEHGTSSAGGTR